MGCIREVGHAIAFAQMRRAVWPRQLSFLFSYPTKARHNAGGTVDGIITRSYATGYGLSDDNQVNVSVVDVGVSDHNLLTRPLPALYIAALGAS